MLGVGWLGSEYVSLVYLRTFARAMTPRDHPADHDDPLKRAMMSLTRRLVALRAVRIVATRNASAATTRVSGADRL